MSKLYIKHLDQATNNIGLEERSFLFIRCKHKFNRVDKTHDNSIKIDYPITWEQVKEKLSKDSLIAEYKPELENNFEYLRSHITEVEERVAKFKGKTDDFDRFYPSSTCILDIREDEEVALTFLDVSFLGEYEKGMVDTLIDTFREVSCTIRFYDPYFYAYVESILNRLLWRVKAREDYNYRKVKAKLELLSEDKLQ